MTGTAIDKVVPAAVHIQRVVAVAAADSVVACAVENGVVTCATEDQVVAIGKADPALIIDQIVAVTAKDGVIARFIDDRVVASIAREGIVASATDDGVVTVKARDEVGARRADQGIVAGGSVHDAPSTVPRGLTEFCCAVPALCRQGKCLHHADTRPLPVLNIRPLITATTRLFRPIPWVPFKREENGKSRARFGDLLIKSERSTRGRRVSHRVAMHRGKSANDAM